MKKMEKNSENRVKMVKKTSINKELSKIQKKLPANTLANTIVKRDMSLKYPKGNDGLTEKQRVFVEIYTDNEGRMTPTACARQAGYNVDRAHVTASELLNIKKFPRVTAAVMKRREEIATTHRVQMSKHVQELARLREKALGEKSYSAAVNAERLRGQAAGLYVERKEIRTGSIDDMSREDVLKQLKELGLDGKFRKEGNQTVLSVEEKSDGEGIKDITEVQTEDSEGQKEV
jgi:phage terminase small subunit